MLWESGLHSLRFSPILASVYVFLTAHYSASASSVPTHSHTLCFTSYNRNGAASESMKASETPTAMSLKPLFRLFPARCVYRRLLPVGESRGWVCVAGKRVGLTSRAW
ncbi:hypothetical protein BDV95DRAFT_126373 [Massariosphaeria phaeospora]|uniref:Uncharacterized protein n=1 Tax=Massariosphaeria phaeospora TaxID=100035 RepID=A0A7C8M7Y1_9PLEO|nr:hypothetical protein BDV95DRAFT_126373 [Massariosphaeria phaeospora]